MQKLTDAVKNVEIKTTKNIAELDQFSIQNLRAELKKGVNQNGEDFEYWAVYVGEDEYRVPLGVMVQIRTLLENNPNADVARVVKTGEGLKSKYQLVQLDGKR